MPSRRNVIVEDRKAGQSVRVEIPEDEDPLAALAGSRDPRREHLSVGQEARVMERILRGGEKPVEGRGIKQAAACE